MLSYAELSCAEVFNYSEFCPSVGSQFIETHLRNEIRGWFSTIPNFALRLGLVQGANAYRGIIAGFQLFRILPFGWDDGTLPVLLKNTDKVFNYSEFCPSVGMIAGSLTAASLFLGSFQLFRILPFGWAAPLRQQAGHLMALVFNYSEFCPSVGHEG